MYTPVSHDSLADPMGHLQIAIAPPSSTVPRRSAATFPLAPFDDAYTLLHAHTHICAHIMDMCTHYGYTYSTICLITMCYPLHSCGNMNGWVMPLLLMLINGHAPLPRQWRGVNNGCAHMLHRSGQCSCVQSTVCHCSRWLQGLCLLDESNLVLYSYTDWTEGLQLGRLVPRNLTSCTLWWVLERLQACAGFVLCSSFLHAVHLCANSNRRHMVCKRHAALTLCIIEWTLPRPNPAPNPVCNVRNTVSTLHHITYRDTVACGDRAMLDSRTHSLGCIGRLSCRFLCATMEQRGGSDSGTLPVS